MKDLSLPSRRLKYVTNKSKWLLLEDVICNRYFIIINADLVMLSDRQNPIKYFFKSEVRDRFRFLPKNPLYRSNAMGAAFTTTGTSDSVIVRFDTAFHSDF